MTSPTPTPTPTPVLDIAGLESVYDALAVAIDDAGETRSELLLVKLALLCADALGDAGHFRTLLDAAARDLAPEDETAPTAGTVAAAGQPFAAASGTMPT